ncbi:5322_t:CDS:2 [Funneliformis geosporum]|nr:5322_t:CDS:2 [Funneliformis geosporum]
MDGNSEDPSMTVKLMMLFKLQQNKVVEKIIMGNISPFTPSSAPMAKHDHGTHKLLHYTNSRNGRVIGPNSTNTSSSPSLSTSPAKQLKRHNRIREMQATSFILSNSGVVSAATNSMGKCYADTVAIGNGAKTSSNGGVNSNEYFASHSPSEEFLKLCQTFTWLNDVKDDQRFADKFVKRRKADASPTKSGHLLVTHNLGRYTKIEQQTQQENKILYKLSEYYESGMMTVIINYWFHKVGEFYKMGNDDVFEALSENLKSANQSDVSKLFEKVMLNNSLITRLFL